MCPSIHLWWGFRFFLYNIIVVPFGSLFSDLALDSSMSCYCCPSFRFSFFCFFSSLFSCLFPCSFLLFFLHVLFLSSLPQIIPLSVFDLHQHVYAAMFASPSAAWEHVFFLFVYLIFAVLFVCCCCFLFSVLFCSALSLWCDRVVPECPCSKFVNAVAHDRQAALSPNASTILIHQCLIKSRWNG